VLGTMHVATGRSDHLGGHLVPKLFKNAKNATHDDILFHPRKRPRSKSPRCGCSAMAAPKSCSNIISPRLIC